MTKIADQIALNAKNFAQGGTNETAIEDAGPSRRERYEAFVDAYEKRDSCENPLQNREKYAIPSKVAETIEMTDFIIEYNCAKQIKKEMD